MLKFFSIIECISKENYKHYVNTIRQKLIKFLFLYKINLFLYKYKFFLILDIVIIFDYSKPLFIKYLFIISKMLNIFVNNCLTEIQIVICVLGFMY